MTMIFHLEPSLVYLVHSHPFCALEHKTWVSSSKLPLGGSVALIMESCLVIPERTHWSSSSPWVPSPWRWTWRSQEKARAVTLRRCPRSSSRQRWSCLPSSVWMLTSLSLLRLSPVCTPAAFTPFPSHLPLFPSHALFGMLIMSLVVFAHALIFPFDFLKEEFSQKFWFYSYFTQPYVVTNLCAVFVFVLFFCEMHARIFSFFL